MKKIILTIIFLIVASTAYAAVEICAQLPDKKSSTLTKIAAGKSGETRVSLARQAIIGMIDREDNDNFFRQAFTHKSSMCVNPSHGCY